MIEFKRPENGGSEQPPEAEDPIEQLVRGAGPRAEPPPEVRAQVKEAVLVEFRRATAGSRPGGRQRTLRWTVGILAAAAALVLAVGLGFQIPGFLFPAENGAAVATVATLERISGFVAAADAGSATGQEGLEEGQALAAGAVLSTGSGGREGRAAFRLADGATVRLDRGSEVRLVSASRLELAAGALYVDSGDGLDGLEIGTPYGLVRDIGTRFEVRWSAAEETLRIRVRDGRVQLVQAAGTHEAGALEELTATADGVVGSDPVAAHDAGWDWTREILPPREIEGSSLADFLTWVSRETGQSLRFGDPALAEQAAAVTLHGSIEGLNLDEALSLVLAGSGLVAQSEEAELRIRPAR